MLAAREEVVMSRSGGLTAILVLVAVASASGATASEEGRILTDKWYVTLGGYLAEIATDAQASSGDVIGTAIRAEDQLGLDDQKSTYRMLVEYRFGSRHAVGLDYFRISRSGDTTLQETIEFEGNTYDVGVNLASDFLTEVYNLQYRYSFVNDGMTEAGFQAGLSTWNLEAAVAGDATVDDGMGGTTTEFRRAGEDVLAPVPTFGLFVRHAFTPRFVFHGSASFLRLNVGDIEGRLVDTKVLFDYFFSRHVGMGVGFNGTDMSYKDTGDDPLSLDYVQSGALAYLSLAF
jgi:hypothetical protein